MCRKSSTTGSRTDPQKRAHVSPFSPLCRPPRRTPNDENTPCGQSRGGAFASPGAFPRGRFLCFRGPSRVFFIYDFGRSAVRDIFVFGFAGHASGGRTTRFSGGREPGNRIGISRRKETVKKGGKVPDCRQKPKTPLSRRKKRHIKPARRCVKRKGGEERQRKKEKRKSKSPAIFRAL